MRFRWFRRSKDARRLEGVTHEEVGVLGPPFRNIRVDGVPQSPRRTRGGVRLVDVSLVDLPPYTSEDEAW